MVLVTYDVNTTSKEGRRRLRRVAKACAGFGDRVQLSVFECLVGEPELVRLRKKICDEILTSEDSVRIYHLGAAESLDVEHFGIKQPRDLTDPFVV